MQDKRNSVVFGRALVDLDQNGGAKEADLSYLADQKNAAGKYFDTLREMARRNKEQDRNVPPTVEQEAAFGRAMLDVGADRREFWGTQSFEQLAGTYGGQLTRTQLGQLGQELEAAHKSAAELGRSDRQHTIEVQVRDRLITGVRFPKDQTKWTEEQWTIYSRALSDVKAEQRAFLVNKQGAQPTPDDVKKWIDKPLAKVRVSMPLGWMWNGELIAARSFATPKSDPVFNFTTQDSTVQAAAEELPRYQGRPSVFIIPPDEQKVIDAQLKANNLPVTDEYRQLLFKRRHGFR
jgi:hypothetical protein